MVTFGVADLSWLMHKSAHALPLSFDRGGGEVIPTGHVYGVLRDVQAIAPLYDFFVLAVDSVAFDRRALFSGYKAGRRVGAGSGEAGYNIFRDLDSILALVSAVPNCWLVRREGYEADDLISSFIALTDASAGLSLSVYHNDADILQVPGVYGWFNKIGRPAVDRVQYLSSKYGFDPALGVDWLPLLVKMVRGDGSDNIPAAVPRFPSKLLARACSSIGRGVWEFGVYRDALLGAVSGTRWDAVVRGGDVQAALELNYGLIRPKLLGREALALRKLEGDIPSLLRSYGISSFWV